MAAKKDKEKDKDEENEQDNQLNAQNVEKYKAAANITQDALNKVIARVVPGAKVLELAELGDKLLLDGVAHTFNKKKDSGEQIEKGIAFPTSIAVNECVGNNSPEEGDARQIVEGDVVKIDLGCHIDGYIASAAHTVIVSKEPLTDSRADLINATHWAGEAVRHLLKVGAKTVDISTVIKKVADSYGVTCVEGVLSHQIKRFVIDANKVIGNSLNLERAVPDNIIEAGEVYCIDIVLSTGDGKNPPKENQERQKTTIFKRSVENKYQLKLSLRHIETKVPRVGIKDMIEHQMLETYPVLFEKNGTFVAQVKYTIFVLPTKNEVICGGQKTGRLGFVEEGTKIEDPSVLKILELISGGGKKKKKGKKEGKGDGAEEKEKEKEEKKEEIKDEKVEDKEKEADKEKEVDKEGGGKKKKKGK
ncbi:MAG: putative Proliferation-associated protein A [Streblomastix strix]|uniref:Putative Proliferation-associated protein A n=1 Tax=Streblomastix strix TaxID=222440 RepID=A0A5J4X829_9EUKA|nr:MAG: putative Proliferation-associated protein A [Streblomastix strix]